MGKGSKAYRTYKANYHLVPGGVIYRVRVLEVKKGEWGKSIYKNRENLIDERKDFTVSVISDYNVMAAISKFIKMQVHK